MLTGIFVANYFACGLTTTVTGDLTTPDNAQPVNLHVFQIQTGWHCVEHSQAHMRVHTD